VEAGAIAALRQCKLSHALYHLVQPAQEKLCAVAQVQCGQVQCGQLQCGQLQCGGLCWSA
jgi:hypothetical protein